MALSVPLDPTLTGVVLSTLAVVAGAPLFSDGLRALRLRRLFRRLKEAPLREAPTGFIHVRGQVALESPLFSPLGAVPCAGYRLEVRGVGTRVGGATVVRRAFRLAAGGVEARVTGETGRWDLAVTAEREVGPAEALSGSLQHLLDSIPEARWLRRRGVALRLVERALLPGAECHVIGHGRHARPLELEAEVELARTGTGGTVPVAAPPSFEPDLWIGSGEHLDFLLISDRAPDCARLVPSRLRVLGVLLGPLLGLLGMIYLAHAGDALRAGRGI
jgi:hypothetical protein